MDHRKARCTDRGVRSGGAVSEGFITGCNYVVVFGALVHSTPTLKPYLYRDRLRRRTDRGEELKGRAAVTVSTKSSSQRLSRNV